MEAIVFLVITGIVFLGSAIHFFTTNKNGNGKKTILYFLLFSVLMSLSGFITATQFGTTMPAFFILQLLFALLGFAAHKLSEKQFWGDLSSNSVAPVTFILMNAAGGSLGFFFIAKMYCCAIVAQYFALTAITFVLPQFFATSFYYFKNIPHAIHKIWYFPIDADEVDYENIDTSVIYMMELEYSKAVNDNRLTNTKLRAPLGIKFGDWFRSFVAGYNDRNAQDPIYYAYADNTPMGWIFYVKPSFFGTARFIDPELSIKENKLTEKNVIVARRVEVQ